MPADPTGLCATVRRVHLQPLAIDGVFRATPRTKGARRFDWFRTDALAHVLPPSWQPAIGTTYTALAGQVEGLHCERGHRVVTCVSGRVALVVVDVRVGAPTFGRWIPIDLDTVNRVTVIIPPDTAWGFQAFTGEAALSSLHEEAANGIRIHPADTDLAIAWPLAVTEAAGTPLAEVLDLLPAAP